MTDLGYLISAAQLEEDARLDPLDAMAVAWFLLRDVGRVLMERERMFCAAVIERSKAGRFLSERDRHKLFSIYNAKRLIA